jgi:hypothetical protein
MNLQDWFTNHTHYWGVPHLAEGGGRLIHECYECGKQRESILGTSSVSEQLEVLKQAKMVAAKNKLTNTKN